MRIGNFTAPDLGEVVFFAWDRSIKRGRVFELRASNAGVHVAIQHFTEDGDKVTHVVSIADQWASPVDAANAVFGREPEPPL